MGAISEGLRQEMAPFGVKVTTICPGVVNVCHVYLQIVFNASLFLTFDAFGRLN